MNKCNECWKKNHDILLRFWHRLWPFILFLKFKATCFPIFHIIYSNYLILCAIRPLVHAEIMTKEKAGEKEISNWRDSHKGSSSVKERGTLHNNWTWENFGVILLLWPLYADAPASEHRGQRSENLIRMVLAALVLVTLVMLLLEAWTFKKVEQDWTRR